MNMYDNRQNENDDMFLSDDSNYCRENSGDYYSSDNDEPDRMVAYRRINEDRDEPSLRPLVWSDYYGQDKVKANLQVFIQAALERNEALDHVLLYGPPGLGKTTLAGIIAGEMKSNLRITSGPAIEKAGDLAAILTNLQPRDVLFIDEIHRLNHSVEEILYPAMEDRVLDLMIGKGPSARSVRLDLAPFTLVGATTKAGNLSAPLRDRFGVINRLELYDVKDLAAILKRDAEIMHIGITEEAVTCLAERSRGTPRIAIRLLRRLRDFAQVASTSTVTRTIAENGLKALCIDELGLDETDRNILIKIIDFYHGGPVGLDTIAAITGEDRNTIEDMYEPYLMQLGFLSKTPRGRVLTPAAFKHVNRPVPDNYQGS